MTRAGQNRKGWGVWWENLKEGDELKNVGFRGDDVKIDREETEWSHLAKDRDRWTTLVNTPVNSGFQKCGDFLY